MKGNHENRGSHSSDLICAVNQCLVSLRRYYLMRFIPAILISCPKFRPVIEQGLTTGRVAPCQHSVVQRSQATAVFVVWRRSERQESLAERHRDSVCVCVCVWVCVQS